MKKYIGKNTISGIVHLRLTPLISDITEKALFNVYYPTRVCIIKLRYT